MKDVAKALGDLISATKAAAGKSGDDPAVYQLKNSAKVGGLPEAFGRAGGGPRGQQQYRRALSPPLHPILSWFLAWQVMVTNVTSLLKTVKAVEDEATKGTRALEATIEHIRQELAVSVVRMSSPPLPSPPPPDSAPWSPAGVLLPSASGQDLHTRGFHSHDQRHHHGHSQGRSCWQLLSAGGCDCHGQPEPPCRG